jgi:hypothetical protein
LSRSFPALPGLLVVVQVPGYASVISIGAGRSPAKFLSQAAGGAYRRGDAAASAIQGRMAFKNGGTFLVLILKHRHHARQEQGYGQTKEQGYKIARQRHPKKWGIVGKKRMMGKEERIRQTTRQGMRKRRNTLEMMMMMVNTEAVRIAKMNPEAGTIAEYNRKRNWPPTYNLRGP